MTLGQTLMRGEAKLDQEDRDFVSNLSISLIKEKNLEPARNGERKYSVPPSTEFYAVFHN